MGGPVVTGGPLTRDALWWTVLLAWLYGGSFLLLTWLLLRHDAGSAPSPAADAVLRAALITGLLPLAGLATAAHARQPGGTRPCKD